MDRIIFHIDVNSAFLSWSAVKLLRDDPTAQDLRLIPSAVGGDVQTRHGVITAKSIPAKKYGVTTGEPVVTALRKCPQLVLVKSDRKTYREYSNDFINILRKYADEIEKVSIDEAFLDMTDSARYFEAEIAAGEPYPCCAANHIKNEIRDTLGFTVNVGISTNKILAKMASDFEKPDKIHTLYPEEIGDKLWPLPIEKLFGCGEKTAEKLRGMGIKTIGELAHADMKLLRSVLGNKSAEYLHKNANGISTSPVTGTREKAKSYSNETTTREDITDSNYESIGLPIVQHLADGVAKRLQKDKVRAFTVYVIVKTAEFKRHTRQTTLITSTNSSATISATAEQLMSQLLLGRDGLFSRGDSLRLIGVGCSNLDENGYEQLDLFSWAEAKKTEDEKKKAEADRRMAEEEKKRAEADRRMAEEEKKKAEVEQQKSEEIRKRTEAEQQKSEEIRKKAEAEKLKAEENRKKAEENRIKSEAIKKEEQRKKDLQKQEKQRRLDEMLSKVQGRYGTKSLHKGASSGKGENT